jgi:tagatose-6-phosphate ketose/aldose isomerase
VGKTMKILGIESKELERINAYYTFYEMLNQPNLWLEGLRLIEENKRQIEDFIKEIISIEGLKIYLIGAGSSAKAASIAENYIKRITKKDVIALPSTSFITHPDNYLLDESPALLVSFGSSGNTTEGLEAVELFKQKCMKLYQMLIICSEEGEIISRYSCNKNVLYIPIPKGTKGRSIAATSEFTLLIQYALMLFDINNFNYYKVMFDNVIYDAANFFEKDIYKSHAVSNRKYDTIVALGSNQLMHLASEMCLKVNELSFGIQNAQFDSILEFRHGPKLKMNTESLLNFFFSNDNHAAKYEIDMLKECYFNKKETTIAAISMNYNSEIDENSDYYFYFNENNFCYKDDSHLIFQYSLYLQSIALLTSVNLALSPDKIDDKGFVNKVAQGVKVYKKY